MRDEQHRFLALHGQVPARLNAEQTAWLLNCQPHDIPILVTSRLLKPLGNPRANSVRYFATADVLERASQRGWLAKVTETLSEHWQAKNRRRVETQNDANAGQQLSPTRQPWLN
jgi:hypothetical protein